MKSKVSLTVTAGPIQGKVFTFEEHDTFIFGRAEDCHARLSGQDTTASRHHFLLEVNPPDARLQDIGSRNGTYVNGKKYGGRLSHLTPEQARNAEHAVVDLKDGDEIKVGETVFKVLVEKRVEVEGSITPVSAVSGNTGAFIRKLFDQASSRSTPQDGDISNYELGDELGQGAMGVVYRARRKSDGQTVAIKTLLAGKAVDEWARETFKREIESTSGLSHPNIVRLYDFNYSGNLFYFALEYCSGGSIYDLMLRQDGVFTIDEAIPMFLQALDGLAYAHDQGLVHRDLKPQNILLIRTGNGTIAKVGDFGLSKSFEKAGLSGFTKTGTVGGTFPFMAREQLTNYKYVKPPADVWSMAATLYFMLTGDFPRETIEGQSGAEAVMRGHIVPIRGRDPDVPRAIASVIDRALADKAPDRYQNAGELRDALRQVV